MILINLLQGIGSKVRKYRRYQKEYRESHREKQRITSRIWYKENKARHNETSHRWQCENRDLVKTYEDTTRRKKRLLNREGVIWEIARKRAKKRGLEFSITPEDIKIPSICPVLGIPIDKSDKCETPDINSPSIDRINNSKGYTPENIRIISNRANRLKNDASPTEIERLYLDSEKIKCLI